MKEFDDLKEIIAAATDDMTKFDGGNKAAGVRVRKSMQEAIAKAKDVRKKVVELREKSEAADVSETKVDDAG